MWRKISHSVDGNVNWYNHYGDSFKKLKIELPYDPTIPLLGIYLEKSIIRKDTHALMFNVCVHLFIYNSHGTNLKSINREMDKEDVTHIHNGILLIHKKNKIMPFAVTWMDLETHTHKKRKTLNEKILSIYPFLGSRIFFVWCN